MLFAIRRVFRSRDGSGWRAFLLAVLLAIVAGISPVHALSQKLQVEYQGNYAIIGNTLAHDAGAGGSPTGVGATGTNTADSAPDVYWQADGAGAVADTSIAAVDARSSATVTLPAGAVVTHAYLFWTAMQSASTTGTIDSSVLLLGPGDASFTSFSALGAPSAPVSTTAFGNFHYICMTDVTSFVKSRGSGAYRVSGVDAASLVNVNNDNAWSGWSLAVFYFLPTQPRRNMSLYYGLDVVLSGSPVTTTPGNFSIKETTPGTSFLSVFAMEGDSATTGDSLAVNNITVSNALNTSSNFFNSTRSHLGSSATSGSVPSLTGAAGSMSGVDLDTVDCSTLLTVDATSAAVRTSTTNDTFAVGAMVFSTPVNGPTITAISPNNGVPAGGTTVTITCTDFVSGEVTAVRFGGMDASSFTWVNSTTITAVTPARSPGRVDVSITGRSVTTGLITTTTYYEGYLYRHFPEIAVTGNSTAIADGDVTPGSADHTDFQHMLLGGTPIVRTFTISNSGAAVLSFTGSPIVSIGGPQASDFAVVEQPAIIVPPNESLTFQIRFTPSALGLRSATVSIANDDQDENPYNFSIQGRAFDAVTDTDQDGMTDWREVQLSSLGFDWNLEQTALVNTFNANAAIAGFYNQSQYDGNYAAGRTAGRNDVTTDPNPYGLYTPGQVQALHVGTPLLTRSSGGQFTLKIAIRKSTTLQPANFSAFPMTLPQTAINGSGELEFTFTAPDDAAFYRLEAK